MTRLDEDTGVGTVAHCDGSSTYEGEWIWSSEVEAKLPHGRGIMTKHDKPRMLAFS